MKDLLVQFKFKNNIFAKALEKKMLEYGIETITEFSKLMIEKGIFSNRSIRKGEVSSFGNLTGNPRLKDGRFRPSAIEISKALGVPPEELYPVGLYAYVSIGLALPKIELETDSNNFIALDSPEVLSLDSGVDIEEEVSKQISREKFHELLQALFLLISSRERKILTMRFGLEDGVQHTLEEVGIEFNVTRERVRSIEAKVLENLRNNKISEKFFAESTK